MKKLSPQVLAKLYEAARELHITRKETVRRFRQRQERVLAQHVLPPLDGRRWAAVETLLMWSRTVAKESRRRI